MKFKKLTQTAISPKRAGTKEAGIDFFFAPENNSSISIMPQAMCLLDTGIACEIPEGHFGMLKDRSSMAKNYIHVLGGILDSSYRGSIKVMLINLGRGEYVVNPGDKIVQMIVLKYNSEPVEEAEELSSSERGEKGFGSSGK